MKVEYLGRASFPKSPDAPRGTRDVIELLENNWDDFGYRTTFPTTSRINGESHELGSISLLIDGQSTSSRYLNRLRDAKWNGVFPIPGCNYISVPSEITFYEQIIALLGRDVAIDVAKKLRDASYLVNIEEDADALALVKTEGFQKSLQRERGSVKSFVDGWKLFSREAIAVLNLGFRFRDVCGGTSTLNLKFQSDNPLPHDINVLIGPNGAGKSQVLHQLVQDWIVDESEREADLGFAEKPNLSQVVVLSYSPFETFPVDLQHLRRQDKGVYRYFGFRGRTKPTVRGQIGEVELTHEAPKRNAAQSLIACLADDRRYRALPNWAQKLTTVENVLQSAFEFDFAAVRVTPDIDIARFYRGERRPAIPHPASINIQIDDQTVRYIPISADAIDALDEEQLRDATIDAEGVVFFHNGQMVELSSGQRLFSFVVVNILGAIRRDSLVLIDEPELFLHPNLEIQFIAMLKEILAHFNSKALLATHSVVTVREIPADCVHVFERTDDGLVVKHPPFQTFGGDVQRITSYVFGDQAVSKPFERWIEAQLEEQSADALIESLAGAINEELIIQIRAMGRGRHRW